MKKHWIFLLGMLAGMVLTIVVLLVIGKAINSGGGPNMSGMTFFDQPGDVIELNSVKVFQALSPGTGLAYCKNDVFDDLYLGTIVLLYNEESTPYYDDQIVTAPYGKCFRQVGIYRYHAKEFDKTVPIVKIADL